MSVSFFALLMVFPFVLIVFFGAMGFFLFGERDV
jgi:hypothetical protein